MTYEELQDIFAVEIENSSEIEKSMASAMILQLTHFLETVSVGIDLKTNDDPVISFRNYANWLESASEKYIRLDYDFARILMEQPDIPTSLGGKILAVLLLAEKIRRQNSEAFDSMKGYARLYNMLRAMNQVVERPWQIRAKIAIDSFFSCIRTIMAARFYLSLRIFGLKNLKTFKAPEKGLSGW